MLSKPLQLQLLLGKVCKLVRFMAMESFSLTVLDAACQARHTANQQVKFQKGKKIISLSYNILHFPLISFNELPF